MGAVLENYYLGSSLEPLAPYLQRPDITDIYVNRPGEIWIETLARMPERIEAPALTRAALAQLARQIAATSAQGISRAHPLLAASLPDGSRIQIVMPPATRGEIALAVRKHVVAGLTLDDYDRSGAFTATETGSLSAGSRNDDLDSGTTSLKELLRQAVQRRKNILVSGGTSTGKTTFLNALLREVPSDERLILIEDTPELLQTHANSVGLVAARSDLGEAEVTAEDLLIASLRMRPDRIILGEMRGKEAVTFLRAVNTGHPGSLSTIHADSPERAVDQLSLLVLQAGTRLEWDDVVRYVVRSVDYIVHLERFNGKRIVRSMISTDTWRSPPHNARVDEIGNQS